jgi:DNA invertase Pin-like site-specific DNA recombinase
MNITYGRISTSKQNNERQTTKGYKSFIDVCSGSIPFFERPQAKNLIKFLKSNPEAITNIIAVDRLGRNTIDILQTVEHFKANNYILKIDNLGIDSNSLFFETMVSIIGTLATLEKKTINERIQQGVDIAHAKGLYKGRKSGTIDNREKILSKHSDIVLCLNENMNVTNVAEVTGKTRATVYKVKKVL